MDKGIAPRTYSRYQDAVSDLEARLDHYCSYCERRIPTGLEVEHISPKSTGGALLAWENFLLACKTCNTAKGKKPASQAGALWPDTDNTLRALCYTRGGFVAVRPGLPPHVQQLAQSLAELVSLTSHPQGPGKKPTRRDQRWSQREQIWSLAEKKKAELSSTRGSERAKDMDNITQIALGYGFFSVWMTVFEDDPEMKRKLVDAFRNTAQDCFSPADCALLNRRNGRI